MYQYSMVANLPPSPAPRHSQELNFLSDVYDVLRASHFRLLNREEWAIALAESFQLNLPLEVSACWVAAGARLMAAALAQQL